MDVADGGKVWTPTTDRDAAAARYKHDLKTIILLGAMTITVLLTTLGVTALFQTSVANLALNGESSSIKLNDATSTKEVADWTLTQLGYNPDDVAETYLNSITDGSVGVIRLKDGSTVEYTVHNTDSNITVTKN